MTAPIVCNLNVFSKKERLDHLDLAMDVIFRLPRKTHELPDGFLFEYHGNDELFLKLARFAREEHLCCSWASFSIEMDPFEPGSEGTIRLRYISGVEAKPALAKDIEHFREAYTNPEVYQQFRKAFIAADKIEMNTQDAFYAKANGNSLLDRIKSSCGC